jgi:hypothetical protein
MREIWLRPNRRAIWFGCVPPVVAGMLGVWLAMNGSDARGVWRWTGVALIVFAAGIIITLLRQLNRPRIAYHDGQVLFYLSDSRPIGVPVLIVEAFFLGQGPAALPAGIQQNSETVNLVARLSQRATDWARRDVKSALGSWCDGYVTIRGTWCEPLGNDVVRRLNRRLKEVQAELVNVGSQTTT